MFISVSTSCWSEYSTALTVRLIVMQSVPVLLLEMAYGENHLKDEKADIITCNKKMIKWLRAMQVNDPIAARAYHVVRQQF